MKMYRCIVVKGRGGTNKKTEFFPPKTQIFYNRPQLPPPGVISKSNIHNKIKMPNNTYVSTAIYNQFNRQSLSISDAPSDRRQGAAGTVPPAKRLRSQWRGKTHPHGRFTDIRNQDTWFLGISTGCCTSGIIRRFPNRIPCLILENLLVFTFFY